VSLEGKGVKGFKKRKEQMEKNKRLWKKRALGVYFSSQY
jgi:hypothetical protein